MGIINIDVSDHLPSFLNLKLDFSRKNEKVKVEFRLINDEKKKLFKNLLANYNWNSIISQNPHLYADSFTSVVNNLYCSAFPLKVKYVSKIHNHNPWMNESILKLVE